MHRVNALVAQLAPPVASAPRHTNHTTALQSHGTNLRQTLHTESPLIHLLDQTLNTAAASSTAPAILAFPALPASITAAEWLALPPHTLLGSSASIGVTQQHIDAFAAVTSDAQWIHSHRAQSLGSPFGRPIAHGFLVLALLTPIVADVLPTVDGLAMTVNYGLERVRWMRPVCADERLVGTVWLERAEQLKAGVVHNEFKVEVRVAGVDGTVKDDKPAMVAVWLARFFAAHDHTNK